ncbi:MAG TPA: AraC family transcriptional regulator [Spirochaetota bacterium]|nr:AraC family transcriptional regulator [Spirochaetota bacterium]
MAALNIFLPSITKVKRHRIKKRSQHRNPSTGNRLLVILKGKGKIKTDNQKQSFNTNTVLLLKQNQRYTVSTGSEIDYIAVDFLLQQLFSKKQQLSRADQQLQDFLTTDFKKYHVIRLIDRKPFINRSRSILEEYYYKDLGSGLLCSFYLMEMIIFIAKNIKFYKMKKLDISSATSTKVENIINNTLKYMKKNYYNDINIDNLFQKHSYHANYLKNMFKEKIGIPPLKCLTILRIEAARKLLLSTDLTVKEIAARVGYKDYCYFIRCFTKYTRIGPASYRKKNA